MAEGIGFTGTRNGMTDYQEVVFEGLLRKINTFRHGSCRGADVQAARIVRKVFGAGVMIICHPGPDNDPCREDSEVDDEVLPGKTHFARNREIVDLSIELIACPWDTTEQPRGGTWYTVRYAQKKNKPVTIIWPDGSIETRKGK